MIRGIVAIFISLTVLLVYDNPAPVDKIPIAIEANNKDSIRGNYSDSVNVALLLYENIEKYSEEYDIPRYIAYNVAYMETRYRGPFHHTYNHRQTSHAGAIGAMQIMPATANFIHGRVDRMDLLNDIELNVEISMKLLKRLYDKHGDWYLVCGAYNTGRPIINGYARYCASVKDYKDKWVKYDI